MEQLLETQKKLKQNLGLEKNLYIKNIDNDTAIVVAIDIRNVKLYKTYMVKVIEYLDKVYNNSVLIIIKIIEDNMIRTTNQKQTKKEALDFLEMLNIIEHDLNGEELQKVINMTS